MAFKAGIKIDLERSRKMLEYAAEKIDSQSSRMLDAMDKGLGMFRGLKLNRLLKFADKG